MTERAATGQAADRDAIEALLEQYFDALHHCDSRRLSEVLHPQALYATASDGGLLTMAMDAYWKVIDARRSAASQGFPRREHVQAIELVGGDTALARVQCISPPKHFDDVLSLLKLDGRWWIIAKVFHYDLVPPEGA